MRQSDCGYDLKDPRWATDRKDHARWCRANPEKAVAAETAWRRGEIKLCEDCRAYARVAAESAAENTKRNCGLSGPRWNGKASDHFAWCMALRGGESAASESAASESARGADIARLVQNRRGENREVDLFRNTRANCGNRKMQIAKIPKIPMIALPGIAPPENPMRVQRPNRSR